MKNRFLFIFSIIGLFMVLVPEFSNAGPIITPPTIQRSSSLENKICQIRNVFCGTTAIAITGFAIFIVGIMMVNNKVHWSVGMILIAGAVIFVGAEHIAPIFGMNSLILIINPGCTCGGGLFG